MSRRLPVLAALVAVLALLMSAVTSTANAVDAPEAGRMSPGFTRDLATLAPTTQYGAFVSVHDGLDAASVVADHASDVQVLRNYPLISTAFVGGPIGSIAKLADVSSVESIHDNATLESYGDTSSWASRVRVAQEAIAGGPYTAGSGGPVLDGSGVGLAVVDSGILAAHPDLSGPTSRNYKFVCSTPGLIYTVTETCYGNAQIDLLNGDPIPTFGFVDVGDTTSDTTSGHGTHVAGIIAGDGTMSTGDYPAGTGPNIKGTYTGVAPGATLYGYSSGEVISVLFAVESLYHVLVHGNSFTPRVSVVNNSWGNPGGTPFDPTDPVNKLADQLVDNNVTVVFAASNDGGTGSTDMTSGYCKNPKPGVICVANYDDEANPGGRDGGLNPSSSRGAASDSSTASWPDISAPGTLVTAACVREVQPICNLGYVDEIRWGPWYSSISGTSMAAPHVSGAIALMLQADPTLTPAQIEDLLQDNAHKFTFGGAYVADPQNPGTGDTTSFDKGAGLLDMKKTLDAMGVSHGTASPASCLNIFDGDGGDAVPGAADLESLCVTQTATGFTYTLELTNASDFGPGPVGTATTVAYRLYQAIKGVEYTIDVNAAAPPAGVSPGVAVPASAVATSASRSGNVVTFTVPFANLGNPAVGEPIYNVRMGAFYGGPVRPITDMAPSPEPAAIALNVRPMWGVSYAKA